MTIKGIGTDIIEISRIQKAIERHGEAFIDRLFSPEEKAYCQSFKDPYPHFAGRFAAKEAIVKAFQTGFGDKISFLDIAIISGEKGEPIVKLSSNLTHPHETIHLSISHCESYAVAFAIRYAIR